MFSGDVQEMRNRFEKQAHNEHSARGGGSFADEGLAVGSLRPRSAVNRESAMLDQCLGWVFVYFDIHVTSMSWFMVVFGLRLVAPVRPWRSRLQIRRSTNLLFFVTDDTTPAGLSQRAWHVIL